MARLKSTQRAPRQKGGGVYTPELADRILAEMSLGKTVNQICRQPGMPAPPTVRLWAIEDVDGFRARYFAARSLLIDHWAEEIVEISDDTSGDELATKAGIVQNAEFIQRSRVRIDTRKWLMSKLRPDQYGEKLQMGGDPSNPVVIEVKSYSPPDA